MGKSAYYLVTFGCLCMINSAAAINNLKIIIGGLDHSGLYNVDESLEGKCIPTDNGDPVEVPNFSNFVVADDSFSCSSGTVPFDRINSLPNATETVSTNDITFTITTPQLRVYTLWCLIGKHVVSICRSAVMYKLETMETDSGFDCKLGLGVDNNFQRPNKVQWLRNGDEKNPLASRSLSETDFADGKSGAYSIKSVSFPLELTPEMAVAGEYECRFTTGQKQILSSKFLTLAAPATPAGKSVALSCLMIENIPNYIMILGITILLQY